MGVSVGARARVLQLRLVILSNKSVLVGPHGQKNGRMEPFEGLLSFQDALLMIITGFILVVLETKK